MHHFVQAIVSIMGPYRTGKSFLLDRLVPHDEGVYPFKVPANRRRKARAHEQLRSALLLRWETRCSPRRRRFPWSSCRPAPQAARCLCPAGSPSSPPPPPKQHFPRTVPRPTVRTPPRLSAFLVPHHIHTPLCRPAHTPAYIARWARADRRRALAAPARIVRGSGGWGGACAGQETLVVLDSPGLFAPNRASVFDAQVPPTPTPTDTV